MANRLVFLIAIVCLSCLAGQAFADVNEFEVQALRDLYTSLHTPQQLQGWKVEGGDPCRDLWLGVECFESTIIHLKLQALGLSGTLGSQLSNLKTLKLLDLSSNIIEGSITNSLPPNVTHLNLAGNRFIQSIPYSFDQMIHLRHLNLSHNSLSGPLGDVFKGLHNLREMDLSFNNLSGDLPTSFQSLTNLTGLFLQNNQFTGSVIFLANLTLSDLNIEDNHFSGMIPERLQDVHNLWLGGNQFGRETNYPPWKFPLDVIPAGQNISSPPSTNLSALESHPTQTTHVHNQKRPRTTGLVIIVGGLTLVATCAALLAVFHKHRLQSKTPGSSGSSDDETMRSPLPISSFHAMYDLSMETDDSPHVSAFSTSPMITPSRLPPIRTKTRRTSKRKSFTRTRMPIAAKVFTVSELQQATNSFSEENCLGGGCLGSVYKAEFSDGQVLAVKNINTVQLSIIEEEQFLDVIRVATRLRHPNIVNLVGYCMEHGHHLIIYEFIRNLSLEDALHSISYKPLSWSTRLQIAFSVAQALDYMHSSIVPPVAHCNLKAANILLDEDMMPHLCDCGLSILRSLTSNSVKIKASEMAIADSGYIAPEHVQHGISNTKADVYALGVLLLELLTGRRPLDYSRPELEQSLVKWASLRLHDCSSLGQMVDPTIARSLSSKTLSHYADIVSVCIQPEQEFRPPMSEIVASLAELCKKPVALDGTEAADSFDRSFRSTNTRLYGSPTLSYYSL